eukprot:gene10096-21036_t
MLVFFNLLEISCHQYSEAILQKFKYLYGYGFMKKVFSLFFIVVLALIVPCITKEEAALVTLVSGAGDKGVGYMQGAVALAQSLIDIGCILPRVALVTPEVRKDVLHALAVFWHIEYVSPIECVTKPQYSLKDTFEIPYDSTDHEVILKTKVSESYIENIDRWKHSCTKLAAWNLTKYHRILFMDSDMLAVGPVHDALYKYSNATFLASPETYPPDTFNSGFMVISPSQKTFKRLLNLNTKEGSIDGGDQGLLNRVLCPDWCCANSSRQNSCGRLPFIYNVPAAKYSEYIAEHKRNNNDNGWDKGRDKEPRVIHFLSEGYSKPWMLLHYEYAGNIPSDVATLFMPQREAQLLWRDRYLRAVNQSPPEHSIFYSTADNNELK